MRLLYHFRSFLSRSFYSISLCYIHL